MAEQSNDNLSRRLVVNYGMEDFVTMGNVFNNSIFYRCSIPLEYFRRLTASNRLNNKFYDCTVVMHDGEVSAIQESNTANGTELIIISAGLRYMTSNELVKMSGPIIMFTGGNEE